MMLNVVTPCSRPYNLPTIKTSVQALRGRWRGELTWWVVLDRMDLFKTVEALPEGFHEPDWMIVTRHDGQGAWGHEQRNYILSNALVEGLVVFVDDDTVVHPDYAPRMTEPGIEVVSQVWGNGQLRLRARPGCLTPNRVDTGMVTFDISLADGLLFPLTYDGDGHFFETLGVFHADKVDYREDHVGSYYNLLR